MPLRRRDGRQRQTGSSPPPASVRGPHDYLASHVRRSPAQWRPVAKSFGKPGAQKDEKISYEINKTSMKVFQNLFEILENLRKFMKVWRISAEINLELQRLSDVMRPLEDILENHPSPDTSELVDIYMSEAQK